ncbi:hypothetical protein JOD54_002142 [Actinokineospora baliensis]|uniref:hypothetical protein n=1 Tax=Actinokineospora baliensis TaxID=547056 RepID=UPI001956CF29|nr:hypothetical protein [Actinokineospora baliensis]MBM7771938.1 hypothetical protein [Actinokineospora baliensis]
MTTVYVLDVTGAVSIFSPAEVLFEDKELVIHTPAEEVVYAAEKWVAYCKRAGTPT